MNFVAVNLVGEEDKEHWREIGGLLLALGGIYLRGIWVTLESTAEL